MTNADSNVNGHPVYPYHGLGPCEAMEEYFRKYPHDYIRNDVGEAKFGFTFGARVQTLPVSGAKVLTAFLPELPRAFRTTWDRVAD